MIYVYDVIVNFSSSLYDFYDWKETDDIETLKKTYLIKVKPNVYKLLVSNNIILDKTILESIKDKTKILSNKKLETLTYCALFSTNEEIIACTFSSNGKILERSHLILDEELELLDLSSSIEETNIKYKSLTNKFIPNLKSRNELLIINTINRKLDILKDNEELTKYLYFEWFDKYPNNTNYLNILTKSINKEYTNKHEYFLSILKLITFNR
ncbi:MAG: hypothetical protein RSB41_02785 [Bacilli bacterium]